MAVCAQLVQPIVVVPYIAYAFLGGRVELPVHGGRARLASEGIDASIAGVLAWQAVLGYPIVVIPIIAYTLIIGSGGVGQFTGTRATHA